MNSHSLKVYRQLRPTSQREVHAHFCSVVFVDSNTHTCYYYYNRSFKFYLFKFKCKYTNSENVRKVFILESSSFFTLLNLYIKSNISQNFRNLSSPFSIAVSKAVRIILDSWSLISRPIDVTVKMCFTFVLI